MSTLLIHHRTVYSYASPVTFGRHRLVIRPREGHDVSVTSMELSISPRHHVTWIRDVFGNSVAIVDFEESAAELSIDSKVLIVRALPFPREYLNRPWQVPYPVTYDPMETAVAAAYTASSYPDDVEAVQHWIKEHEHAAQAEDAENTINELNLLIHRTIGYRRREERGVQTPQSTLQKRTGSCRDMATLMLEAARLMGFAARFASGYLNCPASEAGRAAMHAWVEVYFPMLGWRGFDPTLGEPTSLKHVVAGVSNHPRGVMPISGMYTGDASHYVGMKADVRIEVRN